jgi:hypothetical protein
MEQVQEGNATALEALDIMLQIPAVVDQLGGDLGRQAEYALIRMAAGDNVACEQALIRKLKLLRDELAGPNPTALERLLVDRVAACWLQVQHADTLYAQQMDSLSQEWGDYYQRRMDRAHKRYLSAIKTLALVRKLALPVLQVNIAKKQVNVAGACLPVERDGDEP